MQHHRYFSLLLFALTLPLAVFSQSSSQTVRGYRHAVSLVRTKTKIPLRLPTFVPNAGELYAIVESANSDGYQIQLALTKDCLGGNYCHGGYLSGSSNPLPKEDRQQMSVTLAHGIKGKFVAFSCGAHCDDSAIYWQQGSYYYGIWLKAGKQSTLMKMANSAIDSVESK